MQFTAHILRTDGALRHINYKYYCIIHNLTQQISAVIIIGLWCTAAIVNLAHYTFDTDFRNDKSIIGL